jgi:hypothetical protein
LNFSVLAPDNVTAYSTNSIPVNYSAVSNNNVAVSSYWFGDGSVNYTYPGNSSYLTLLAGSQSLTLYAMDSIGSVSSVSWPFIMTPVAETGGGGGGGGSSYTKLGKIELVYLTRNTTGKFIAEARLFDSTGQLADADTAKVFLYNLRQDEHQFTMQKKSKGHYYLETKLDLEPRQYRMDIVFYQTAPYNYLSYTDSVTVLNSTDIMPEFDILKVIKDQNLSIDWLKDKLGLGNVIEPDDTAPPDKGKLLTFIVVVFVVATLAVIVIDKRTR